MLPGGAAAKVGAADHDGVLGLHLPWLNEPARHERKALGSGKTPVRSGHEPVDAADVLPAVTSKFTTEDHDAGEPECAG